MGLDLNLRNFSSFCDFPGEEVLVMSELVSVLNMPLVEEKSTRTM